MGLASQCRDLGGYRLRTMRCITTMGVERREGEEMQRWKMEKRAGEAVGERGGAEEVGRRIGGSRWAGVDVGGRGGEHGPSPSLGQKPTGMLFRKIPIRK